MKTAYALVLGGVLCAGGIAAGVVYMRGAATPATAIDGVYTGEPKDQALVSEFSGFSGSERNARSLVTGMRQGREITLVAPAAGAEPGAATRFVPPTRSMDHTNVRVALVLAREQLDQLGITRPTPAQLKAVLAGGGVASRANGRASTPFLHPGVLQMRAGGMSWPKIAAAMGVNLAQAVNGRTYQADDAAPSESAHPATAGASRGIAPVAGARVSAPALRRSGATPAPVSSPSITQSSAGGAATPAAIKTATPARRTAQVAREPKARHSKEQVVATADGDLREKNATVPAPDSAQGAAARTATASAAAASDELIASESDSSVAGN